MNGPPVKPWSQMGPSDVARELQLVLEEAVRRGEVSPMTVHGPAGAAILGAWVGFRQQVTP